MFGAISRRDDLPGAAPAEPRDVDEVARLQREGLRAHGARRPRPRGQADQHRLRRVAVHVQVGGDDDQDRQRRDHEHDVREHVQHVVDPAAAVARGEADRGADQPRDPAADRADEERGTQAVDELREHVLAERRRPEPVLRRRRRVGRPAELERLVVREHRAEDRDREQREHEAEAEDELPVPQREVEELGAARRNGRTGGAARRGGRRGLEGRSRRSGRHDARVWSETAITRRPASRPACAGR